MSLGVTAPEFYYDDPDSSAPIQPDEFVAFVESFKQAALTLGAIPNARPFLEYSDVVVDHTAQPVIVWCGWTRIPIRLCLPGMVTGDGQELMKRRGYIPPEWMVSIMDAFIKDPTPGPSVVPPLPYRPADGARLSDKDHQQILENFEELYDDDTGGWGQVHRFIHEQSMDYLLRRAQERDVVASRRARQTLDEVIALIDPVWGGVFQYSDELDWSSPHYEKIMLSQIHYLRQYSLAYLLFDETRYLEAAASIYDYLTEFMLSDLGTFYTSQDADLNKSVDGKQFYTLDDSQRRRLGMPSIDHNVYTRENAWVVSALLGYYAATSHQSVLDQAIKTATHMITKHSDDSVGFRRSESLDDRYYLGDQVALSQAMLDLYAATGHQQWLHQVARTLDFVRQQFSLEEGGFASASQEPSSSGVFGERYRQVEENVYTARTMNLAYRYLGHKQFRELSHHAMKFPASEQVLSQPRFLIGVSLAQLGSCNRSDAESGY